jgi:hypothetical protein
MRLMEGRYQEAVGVWEEADGLIIVKRCLAAISVPPRLQSLPTCRGTAFP